MEPNKPKLNQTPHLNSPRPQPSGGFDPLGSRGQGPYTPPPGASKPKSKNKWLPIMAIAAVLGAGAVGTHYYTIEHNNPVPLPTAAAQSQNVLTLTGADLDQATTAAAIAAIKASQNDNPLIANLTDQQKQEIVSGKRNFYKLPIIPAQPEGQAPSLGRPPDARSGTTSHSDASAKSVTPTAPVASSARLAPPRASTAPETQIAQPAPIQPAIQKAGSRDRVQLSFNGFVYGTYDASGPLTLDAPLASGDEWRVTCLELAPGKSSVTVGIATVLNPVQTTLSLGQSSSWSITRSNPPAVSIADIGSVTVPEPAPNPDLASGTDPALASRKQNSSQLMKSMTPGVVPTLNCEVRGEGAASQCHDYEWFHTQASHGNPVAEYGLGHMYQYGINVPQDTTKAIYWYQRAAERNYLDAKQRLAELGQ
jgi:Sel1 repeat